MLTADTPANHLIRNKKPLRRIFRLYGYVRPYLPQFILGLVFLLASSVADLAFPKLLGNLVAPGGHALAGDIHKTGLLMFALLIAQSAFSFFKTILFVNVTEKTLASLRQVIYAHMVKLPMRFFLERRVGELSSRISADISLLQQTFTTTLAEFIRQLVIITGGTILLLITSWQLTVYMLIVLPLMLMAAVFFGKFIRRLARLGQEQIAASNTVVEETLQGIMSVKAFTNEFFEIARYRRSTNEAAHTGMRAGKYRGAFSSFMTVGIFGALVAVVWRGVIIGISLPSLLAFILYAMFIWGAIAGMAEVYAALQRSIGATEHLLEILDEPQEAVAEIKNIPAEHLLDGQVSFRDVTFRYPSRPDVNILNNVSFEVGKDQRIALVGPSGAGKSTIVSLLLRLYETSAGTILFDGKNSHVIPLSQLRAQIAVVPQDVFLFGGTIAGNIAYGKTDATTEEIEQAAKNANAWDFIRRLPLGLNTIVGERGVQLSGGQRQRIAIARAVLKDPRILILDEATSALDAESEKLVQEALEKLMIGRTSIVIAHRLATIREADKIIVLDNGSVVEEGTHVELINLDGGLYRSLSEMQFTF